MTPPVEMTKGRAALPATVVAEQDPFFIALGGLKAHDSSGRDDKGKGGVVEKSAVSARPVLEMFSIEIFKCQTAGIPRSQKRDLGQPTYFRRNIFLFNTPSLDGGFCG